MNTHYITCRECGVNNASNAQRCRACGADLASLGNPSTAQSGRSRNIFNRMGGWFSNLFGRKVASSSPKQSIQNATTWLTNTPTAEQPKSNRVPNTPAPQPQQPVPSYQTQMAITKGSAIQPITPGQRITERYVIRKYTKHPTGITIYYDAVDLVCPQCQRHHDNLPEDNACLSCKTSLNAVLIHERQLAFIHQSQESTPEQLLHLGQRNHPYILFHRQILTFSQVTYSIVNHPGRWGYVVPGNRTMDEVIAIITQMGKALNFLHQQDYCLSGNRNESGINESWVALPGCNEVRLADLSSCLPMTPVNRAQRVAQDIRFLAQVLFYLTSGILSIQPDPALAPLEFRPYIERAFAGQYQTPMALMQDLSGTPSSPIRQLNASHGQATHPGKKHTVNEDAVVTFTFNKQQSGQSVPVGFYLVADGMGGHDAGDLASRTVNQIVTNWVIQVQVLPDLRKTTRKLSSENVPAEILQRAISEANTALHRHAQSHGSDLGSTVTSVLLIGDTATIANVGDSRTYRLRDSQLDQITRDHSLVARLVEANVITPDEVRSHPRRNEIYRSLGHKPEVQVDTYTVPLQRGDRLLLCCDGLWEMLRDEDIKRIMQASRTPQEACDQLIVAANAAGGEDNISVIVVEME